MNNTSTTEYCNRFQPETMPTMTGRKVIFLFLIVNITITGFKVSSQSLQLPKIPITTIFDVEEYKGGMQNWSITESKEGFLYVANNYGLLEFDGTTWRLYDKMPGHTRTRSVFIDPSDDRIYTGGQNLIGYFDRNKDGSLEFVSLNHLVPDKYHTFDDVWSIHKSDDKIVFSTFQEIFLYNGDKISVLDPGTVVSETFSIDNHLFVYSSVKGLLKVNGEKFQQVVSPIPGVETITGMVKGSPTSYLLFSNGGDIFQLANGNLTRVFPTISKILSESIILSARRLRTGLLAIGTQNSGLYILNMDGKILYHITKNKGLHNRTVLTLYEDRFQNLWVGSNNGIAYVELTSPFSVLDERSGLPGTGYAAVKHNGHVYLGTSNGLYTLNKEVDTFSGPFELVKGTEGQVYNLSIVGSNLILSHHNGAYLVDDKKAQLFFSETGTWKFTPHPTLKNRIIGGTYEGFYLFDQKNEQELPKVIGKIPALKESSRIFEFDENYDLWMTHGYKGVFKLKQPHGTKTTVEFYNEEKGFPSNILINVFEIEDELVFTAENGVFSYDSQEDAFKPNSSFTDLLGADTHISFLKEDLFGNVYFISDQQVGVLKKDNLNRYRKELFPFEKINHLISDDLNNISILDRRNILIGARDGFLHYDPMALQQNNHDISAIIKSIEIDGDEFLRYELPAQYVNGNLSFTEISGTIRFHYTSPDFTSVERMKYSYQLANFDEEWSEYNSNTVKEYTNLPPGDYTFLLKTKDAFGRESKIERIPFQITPIWYKSPVAYASYTILTLFLFGLVVFGMNRSHQSKMKQSELNQQEILKIKENELDIVTKESEKKITRLKNEKLKVEIEHKNKALATTTMHLINKTDLMNGLKNRLKHILEDEEEKEKGIRQIIKDLEKNDANDDEWKNFERHFDHAHSNFLQKLKEQYPELTQQDMKLSAFLRMNMSSKEIASLLNISVRGVEISRYRLRKKLSLNKNENLVDFMLRFSAHHDPQYHDENNA